MRRTLVWGGGVLALLIVAFVVFLNPAIIKPFDGAPHLKNGARYDVRILRDSWGVPHIYGKRDEYGRYRNAATQGCIRGFALRKVP